MKTKTNLVLIIIYFIFNFTVAQDLPSFYIEVPNSNNIPVVTHDQKGNRIKNSNTGNRDLDKLINSYEIYSNDKVFTNSRKPSLQNIYMIVCNDKKLMDELFAKYSKYYPRVEYANGIPLLIPNDFGTIGGYTLSAQEELTYMRAPEAWDITTGLFKDVIIGIADYYFNPRHEDLENTITIVSGNNLSGNSFQHGTSTSVAAAGNTNNSVGLASVGYHSHINASVGANVSAYHDVAFSAGVKVVNASWYTFTTATPSNISDSSLDEIHDNDIVMVAAAGNNNTGNPSDYFYPASYRNVISVSSIGQHNASFTTNWQGGTDWEIFLDSHEYKRNGVITSYQHNDSIDIVAPGYDITYANGRARDWYGQHNFGTSFAAPFVAGTVALMFDVNYCLKPNEVESILKLTAVKIDNLPQNLSYYGKLGAGKLDIYEAVKMAKDMADPFGTVEVKDRILYRPWFYKLATAPYEIKMTNNNVSLGSKLKFRARNNIEILSGEYFPSSGGYVDLQIDPNLDLNHCPPPPSQTSSKRTLQNTKSEYNNLVEVFPTLVLDELNIKNNSKEKRILSVEIYDLFGVKVYNESKINSDKTSLKLNNLRYGIYIVKVYDNMQNLIHTEKIIKK